VCKCFSQNQPVIIKVLHIVLPSLVCLLRLNIEHEYNLLIIIDQNIFAVTFLAALAYIVWSFCAEYNCCPDLAGGRQAIGGHLITKCNFWVTSANIHLTWTYGSFNDQMFLRSSAPTVCHAL